MRKTNFPHTTAPSVIPVALVEVTIAMIEVMVITIKVVPARFHPTVVMSRVPIALGEVCIEGGESTLRQNAGRAGSPLPAAGWNECVLNYHDGAHGVTRPTR